MSTRIRAIALVVSLAVPLLAHGQGNGNGKKALSARFEQKAIVVEGVSPHQDVLLFGVSVEARVYQTATRRWDRVASDDDGDGKVVFAFDKAIEHRSLWAIVDLHGGDYVVLTPEGYDLPRKPLPSASLRRGERNDEVAGLDLGGSAASIVIVRGGAGAWGIEVDQDGRNDDDRGQHGVMRVDPSKLTSLAGNRPPPKVLTPGDLVLVINPLDIEFFATRIAR